MVYIEASRQELGYMLIPNGRIIAYTSGQLSFQEMNYLIPELKLATIVQVLKIWKYRLYGESFLIIIKIKRLKYISIQKELIRDYRDIMRSKTSLLVANNKENVRSLLYGSGISNLIRKF